MNLDTELNTIRNVLYIVPAVTIVASLMATVSYALTIYEHPVTRRWCAARRKRKIQRLRAKNAALVAEIRALVEEENGRTNLGLDDAVVGTQPTDPRVDFYRDNRPDVGLPVSRTDGPTEGDD